MIYNESEWTKPTELCPHPGRWHATDAQSAELEVSELVYGFVRALQPGYAIETGTCVGQTAQFIGEALRANGHGRCDSLEVDPDLVAVAAERCAGLPVTVHELSSLDFDPSDVIDFAWFDSLLSLRVAEFARFRPWMRRGTIVGFHDTAPHFGTFGPTVHSLPGVRAITLPTPRGVTFVEVMR